jgi:hypothetical protein
MTAKPQVGFGMRAKRARLAGPAQSSVFHDFARRGPTEEAHRRALIRGGIRGVIGGPIRVGLEGPRNHWRASRRIAWNCKMQEGDRERPGGLNRPRRGRDPAPRPRSADALTRREIPSGPTSAGVKVVRPRPPAPATWKRPGGGAGGLRALHLDPGSGRMVPVTRVGRSALRAAAPAGRGRYRTR